MRRGFDQGICVRPAYLYPGVTSPLAGKNAGDIDMVIFRENTEGEYAPVGGRLNAGTPHETVIQSNVFTRRGTERIIRAAFEHCVRRNKRMKVTSVTKSNAQSFGMVFWDEVFDEVAAEFPQVETESLLVDRACMDFVRWPEDFRRGGGVQPVRRHPFRHRGSGIGQHGPGTQRQHQPRQGAPVAVRAGAWRSVRHHGQRHRQPHRHHRGRGHDA